MPNRPNAAYDRVIIAQFPETPSSRRALISST
jgi:hypothetical protein